MPALGESVTEGTVTRWLKEEGDAGRGRRAAPRGLDRQGRHRDPLPVAGTLTKILVQEDETVPVGADLAIIGGEAAPSAATPAPAAGGRPGAGARTAAARRPPEPAAPAGSSRARGCSRSGGAHGPAAVPAAAAAAPRPAAASEADTTRRPTSPRWCASSPPTAASTSPRSRAPASVGASASRTCWTRPSREEGRRSPRARRPRRLQPPAATPARRRAVGARAGLGQARHHARRCRGCARSSPSGWSSRCRPRRSSRRSSRST